MIAGTLAGLNDIILEILGGRSWQHISIGKHAFRSSIVRFIPGDNISSPLARQRQAFFKVTTVLPLWLLYFDLSSCSLSPLFSPPPLSLPYPLQIRPVLSEAGLEAAAPTRYRHEYSEPGSRRFPGLRNFSSFPRLAAAMRPPAL
eukprot:757757-Hanusia_phi.AAC.1